MMNSNKDEILDFEQACEFLVFGEKAVRRLLAGRRLPVYKVQNRLRFRKSDLQRWQFHQLGVCDKCGNAYIVTQPVTAVGLAKPNGSADWRDSTARAIEQTEQRAQIDRQEAAEKGYGHYLGGLPFKCGVEGCGGTVQGASIEQGDNDEG